ncbi:MAG: hypothetical protein RL139_1135 [Gemmatimonadota bacterium]|jgi:HD-GYP domain-containing protein (c-di-GMP phosphodiesterase class II)
MTGPAVPPVGPGAASLGRVTGSIAAVGLAESAVREIGRTFLYMIYAAMRNMRIYPVDNPVVQKSLEDFTALTGELVRRDGECEVRVAGEYLFLNATRMKLEVDNYTSFSFLLARCRESDVERITFRAPPTTDDWAVVLAGLLEPEGETARERFDALGRRLEEAQVTVFALTPFDEAAAPLDDAEEMRVRAKRTYEQSVYATLDVMEAVREGQSANIKKLKRVVQGVVDQVLADEMPLVGLTTVRGYHEEPFVHAIDVCILSVALGRRLGLSRLQLYQLGFAGLFHDLGMARIPREVLEQTELLTDAEWALVRAHPWLGVLALFQVREQADFAYRSMLVAYQHHMRRDLSGYPRALRLGEMSFYGKIVAVADAYIALTARRQTGGEPLDPAQVLAELTANPGRTLDPVLLKALGAVLGIYPPGTCLVLDTGEVAVVIRPNPVVEMAARPIVRIIRDPEGTHHFPGTEVDLGAHDEAGAFLRTVVATVDGDRHGIRVGDYFL